MTQIHVVDPTLDAAATGARSRLDQWQAGQARSQQQPAGEELGTTRGPTPTTNLLLQSLPAMPAAVSEPPTVAVLRPAGAVQGGSLGPGDGSALAPGAPGDATMQHNTSAQLPPPGCKAVTLQYESGVWHGFITPDGQYIPAEQQQPIEQAPDWTLPPPAAQASSVSVP